MSVTREGKLDSDLPKAPADFKDITTDATNLIQIKYYGDSDKGLINLNACFAHLSIFCITIWQILPYVLMILLDGNTFESGSIFQLALLEIDAFFTQFFNAMCNLNCIKFIALSTVCFYTSISLTACQFTLCLYGGSQSHLNMLV